LQSAAINSREYRVLCNILNKTAIFGYITAIIGEKDTGISCKISTEKKRDVQDFSVTILNLLKIRKVFYYENKKICGRYVRTRTLLRHDSLR
jgi:hypothetical protein